MNDELQETVDKLKQLLNKELSNVRINVLRELEKGWCIVCGEDEHKCTCQEW